MFDQILPGNTSYAPVLLSGLEYVPGRFVFTHIGIFVKLRLRTFRYFGKGIRVYG